MQRTRSIALLVSATFVFAVPAALADNLGGADGTVNSNADVRTVVSAMGVADTQGGDVAAEAVYDGLTPAEQATVKHGLEPGPVQSGFVYDGQASVARAHKLRPASGRAHPPKARSGRGTARIAAWNDYAGTLACWRNSLGGIRLWTYKSRWSWTGSDWSRTIIKADHYEFTGDTAWFWSYKGTQYLWPSGGIGQSYIGRATQGHYSATASVAGVTVGNNDYPVLNVHVHWDGGVWWQCS